MDNVSVIIRAKNEERWIGHTIQSVLDCLKKPQIVIVDNMSTDDTRLIVRYFQQDPALDNTDSARYGEVKIVSIEDYTPGRAINLGVKHCVHDYILVISSHCVLNRIDMPKHRHDLQKHCAVYGNQQPVFHGKRIAKRYLWRNFGKNEVVNPFSEDEGRYFLHNALALYRKQALLDHPVNESLAGKEDRYWANDVIKFGMSILYDPTLSADHHYTERGNTWKGIG